MSVDYSNFFKWRGAEIEVKILQNYEALKIQLIYKISLHVEMKTPTKMMQKLTKSRF